PERGLRMDPGPDRRGPTGSQSGSLGQDVEVEQAVRVARLDRDLCDRVADVLDRDVVDPRAAAARGLGDDLRGQLHERGDRDVAFLDRGGARIGGGTYG